MFVSDLFFCLRPASSRGRLLPLVVCVEEYKTSMNRSTFVIVQCLPRRPCLTVSFIVHAKH